MRTTSEILALRAAAALLAVVTGCFTGDELVGQPCRDDADCNPRGDAFGATLTCRYQVCGYAPRCGDGIVDADVEACDLGEDNLEAVYAAGPGACSASTCKQLPWCGDGAVQSPREACDDGNADDADACARCQPARCGDGFVGPGEACDPGSDPTCTKACARPSCGDGVVQAGEACDDGNDAITDDCVNCMAPVCGDGATWVDHEECDDGNAADDDACLVTCMQARCGDGHTWVGVEGCDDADTDDADECRDSCVRATCGDGVVWAGHEACDDGNAVQEDACLVGCVANVCGDGFVDATAEGCEDLNDDPDDGCDACRMGAEALGSGPASAVVCAIRRDELRCWGENTWGQLGLGHSATVGDDADDLPAELHDLPIHAPDTRVVAVVTGNYFTCALLDDAEVRCWGLNYLGELGFPADGKVYGDGTGKLPAPPAQIGGAVTQLAAGDRHTCARLTSGAVRCWGSNAGFQLGYETPGKTPADSGDVVLGGDALRVTAGAVHTCALLVGGAVHCWGSNEFGQLGYPGVLVVGDDETPAAAGPVDLGGPVEQLAAGAYHTCAMLVDGTVVCWGGNDGGKLGNGAPGDVGFAQTPAQAGVVTMLSDGDEVAALAPGAYQTCVLLTGGGVRCWGLGGLLGYEDEATYGDGDAKPGLVALGGPALALTAGIESTCARLRGGVVRCWGGNTYGQLGVNSTATVGATQGSMPPKDSLLYPNPG